VPGYYIKPAIQVKTCYKQSQRLFVLQAGVLEVKEKIIIQKVSKLAPSSWRKRTPFWV